MLTRASGIFALTEQMPLFFKPPFALIGAPVVPWAVSTLLLAFLAVASAVRPAHRVWSPRSRKRVPGGGGSTGGPAKHWAIAIQRVAFGPSISSPTSAMFRT